MTLTDAEREARAARVRTVRSQLNLSQDELAAALGLSRGSSVSDLERGKSTATPQTLRLLDFIERYGVTPPTTGTPLAAHAATLRSIAAQLEAADTAAASA